MKIAWLSNGPMVGSGYGVQTGMFGPRIANLGHQVAFLSNWGHQGWTAEWNGFQIYPADGEWGNRTFAACAQHFGDGDPVQVIALCDAWVLNPDHWPKDLRIALWAPVDHWPLPPPTRAVLSDSRVTPIAMSRFGERMMQDAGLDPLYVPHGVETSMFRPKPEDREGVRQELNLPLDAFVVGMVAANQGCPQMHRKAFPQQFQAFRKFKDTHPDAVMFVHAFEYASQGGGNGLNLRALAERCGLGRQDVLFTEAFAWELGLSRESLSSLYSAFDVFMAASLGEGFGVPSVEAQACGLPVILTDHSAMTELCGAGWLVGGEDWYDGPQDAWFKSPSVAELVFALDEAYEAWSSDVLWADAREFALAYDADRVLEEHWKPVLSVLDSRDGAQTLEREVVGVD